MNIWDITRCSLFLISLLFVRNCHPVKILYHHSIGCKSTSMFHQTISEILINHGHEIIGLGPFPVTHLANYTDLGADDNFIKFTDAYSLDDDVIGTFVNMKVTFDAQYANCENIYKNSELIRILNGLKLDLVIFEVDGADCFLPLVAQLNVPIIGVGTSSFLFAEFDGLFGNPVNPSYIPTVLSGFSTEMDFIQRVENTKNYILHWLLKLYHNYRANKMVAKYLKTPPIEKLYDRISMVFYNSHFSFTPRPISPTSVGIAGIHIREPAPLPEDIENFIDDAQNGVIYLSFGSVAKFSQLPVDIHDAFKSLFIKLPFKILWKHDKPEMLAGISENIMVRKWFPQKDILAHSKTVLFLSHGGIMSTYEAIHNSVPLLTFPIIFDQFTNSAIIKSLGIGLSLDLRSFNESSILLSIGEILNNTEYRENMKKVSNTFRDRPLSPEDMMIYWVEYVLRHKNVSYLNPAGSKLPFHKYLLLDVISFLFVNLLFMFCIIFISCRYLYKWK